MRKLSGVRRRRIKGFARTEALGKQVDARFFDTGIAVEKAMAEREIIEQIHGQGGRETGLRCFETRNLAAKVGYGLPTAAQTTNIRPRLQVRQALAENRSQWGGKNGKRFL